MPVAFLIIAALPYIVLALAVGVLLGVLIGRAQVSKLRKVLKIAAIHLENDSICKGSYISTLLKVNAQEK